MTTTKTMIILSVWIGNVSMYASGELFGEWVDLSADVDTINAAIDRISRGGKDETIIFDYESTFNLKANEYSSIKELKEKVDFFAEFVSNNGDYATNIYEAVSCHASDYNELTRILESGDYRIYENCYDMADVASEIMNESGELDSIPQHLRCYFDYKAYGRDLDINGHFYYTGGGVYVEIY